MEFFVWNFYESGRVYIKVHLNLKSLYSKKIIQQNSYAVVVPCRKLCDLFLIGPWFSLLTLENSQNSHKSTLKFVSIFAHYLMLNVQNSWPLLKFMQCLFLHKCLRKRIFRNKLNNFPIAFNGWSRDVVKWTVFLSCSWALRKI